MRLITRVIIRDLIVAIAEGVVFITFVFLLKRLFNLTDLFLSEGASFTSTCALLFCLLPFVMMLTFPMAVLLGSLMVYGRMAGDNELTALHAGGYTVRQLLVPAMIVGLLLTSLLFWWGNRIAPKGLRLFRVVATEVLRKTTSASIRSGVFNNLGGFIVLPNESTTEHTTALRMFESRGDRISGVISASSSSLTYSSEQSTLGVSLEAGILHQVPSDDRDVVIKFSEMRFSIGIPVLLQQLIRSGREEQRYSNRILAYWIQEYRRLYPIEPDPNMKKNYFFILKRMEVEQALRRALPFSCLLMAVVGSLLGMASHFGRRSACYGVTIIAIFFYYILLNLGKTNAEAGNLSPVLAVWLPNGISLILALVLYWRTQRV